MPFDPNTPRSRDEVLLQAIVSGDSSAMGDPRDREEEFVKAIADKETLPDYSEASEGDTLQIGADGPEWGPTDALPDYSGASAGDALVIGNDGPEWGAIPNELPAIAAGDAGKVLKVNSGETGVEWGSANATYYTHSIALYNLNTYTTRKFRIVLTFVSRQSTAYTKQTLWDYLHDHGGGICCFGWSANDGNTYFITEVSTSVSGKYKFYEYISTDNANTASSFEVPITNCGVGTYRIST